MYKRQGLSFQENGKTPRGNASADFLKQYNSYYAGNTDKKVIYLTFDAGYENGYTPAILDTLKAHNVKAAFFVVEMCIRDRGRGEVHQQDRLFGGFILDFFDLIQFGKPFFEDTGDLLEYLVVFDGGEDFLTAFLFHDLKDYQFTVVVDRF